MKVLIFGGAGQLGTALQTVLRPDHEVTALGREHCDITAEPQVTHWLQDVRPEVVINTAAFHQVDRCEAEPEGSFAVNAAAPQRLARACTALGALLVHISTDYVFDGEQSTPYHEHHPVNPLNIYGTSKAAREMAIRAVTDNHLIVRTTGLFGPASHDRGNFVETMLRLAREGREISVVNDQVLTPTSALDCAVIIKGLLSVGATGIVHATNSGQCSWYEFAREIIQISGDVARLRSVSQDARPLPARRPKYSVLDYGCLRQHGLKEPRGWEEALRAYLTSKR